MALQLAVLHASAAFAPQLRLTGVLPSAPRCGALVSPCYLPSMCDGKRDDEDTVNRLLDTPLIDPFDGRDAEQPELLQAFKQLIRTDYQLAETLWAGTFIGLMLVVAQAAVRAYKHAFFDVSSAPWPP